MLSPIAAVGQLQVNHWYFELLKSVNIVVHSNDCTVCLKQEVKVQLVSMSQLAPYW